MALADKHFCNVCGAAFNVFFHMDDKSVKYCPNCGCSISTTLPERKNSVPKDININLFIHDERKEK